MNWFDFSPLRIAHRQQNTTEHEHREISSSSVTYRTRTKIAQSRALENLAEREWISGSRSGPAVQSFVAEPRSYWGFSAPTSERRIFDREELAEGMGLRSNLLRLCNSIRICRQLILHGIAYHFPQPRRCSTTAWVARKTTNIRATRLNQTELAAVGR